MCISNYPTFFVSRVGYTERYTICVSVREGQISYSLEGDFTFEEALDFCLGAAGCHVRSLDKKFNDAFFRSLSS